MISQDGVSLFQTDVVELVEVLVGFETELFSEPGSACLLEGFLWVIWVDMGEFTDHGVNRSLGLGFTGHSTEDAEVEVRGGRLEEAEHWLVVKLEYIIDIV